MTHLWRGMKPWASKAKNKEEALLELLDFTFDNLRYHDDIGELYGKDADECERFKRTEVNNFYAFTSEFFPDWHASKDWSQVPLSNKYR